MYFLSINKVKKDADRAQIGKVISGHIQWIKEQIIAGKVVQAGKWGDAGGMAIIRAKDLAEAESIVNRDPLLISGLITAETAGFYPDVAIE